MKPIYKFALIIAVVLLVGVLGYLIWQWLQPHAPETPSGGFPEAPTGEPAATSTTPTSAFELRKLSDDGITVFDSFTDGGGNPFYLATDGIVREAAAGPDPEVTTQTLSAPNTIQPSPNNRYVLLAYGDPRFPQWRVFDTADHVFRPFNVPLIAAAWKDSDTLVGILPGTGEARFLAEVPVEDNFSSDEPAYTPLLRDFPLLDVTLSWSETLNALIVHERSSATYTPRTWQFNVTNHILTLLSDGERGALSSWSRDKYLLQYIPPERFQVLRHAFTLAYAPLFTTLPDKCAVRGDILFCFSPVLSPLFSFTDTFAADYYEGSVRTVDEFSVSHIATREQNRLFVSGTGDIPRIDATHVRAASTSTLYFVNAYDGGLYEVQLIHKN